MFSCGRNTQFTFAEKIKWKRNNLKIITFKYNSCLHERSLEITLTILLINKHRGDLKGSPGKIVLNENRGFQLWFSSILLFSKNGPVFIISTCGFLLFFRRSNKKWWSQNLIWLRITKYFSNKFFLSMFYFVPKQGQFLMNVVNRVKQNLFWKQSFLYQRNQIYFICLK